MPRPATVVLTVILAGATVFVAWVVLNQPGVRRDLAEEGKVVFVTSQVYSGNLGHGRRVLGHLLGDQRCQALADGAGLGGTFKAWISGRVNDARGPLPHAAVHRFNPSVIPYRLVDGTLVAHDWDDLTDGSLQHAIDLTETGGQVGQEPRVWTNTRAGGEAWDNTRQCAPGPNPDRSGSWTWTCGEPSWIDGDCQARQGKFGLATSTTSSWTGTGTSHTLCDQKLHLYCFEQ